MAYIRYIEASQKDIKVDFPIEVKPNGKILKATMMKVLKKLIADYGFPRGERGFFIKDSEGKETYWDWGKDDYYGYDYVLTCELTEDETEKGVDYFNMLGGTKIGRELKDIEYESWKVE